MDPVRNPFAPGAGSPPPELAGRETILAEAEIALQRTLIGNHDQSQILLGLRGTGKTVLLNRIDELAQHHGHYTSFIEAPEDRTLPELLYPRLFQTLRQISLTERAKASAHAAMRALRSFASVFNVSMGDVVLAVDPEIGAADSGDLEYDLTELFTRIGRAAQDAGRGWTLLVDEVQYLSESELSGLIVALHRMAQMRLPIMFFGAGLPQIAALTGNAKSYAERLFKFPVIGALDAGSAYAAIRSPIENQGEKIAEPALAAIFDCTHGYPYFLQEWGYQTWNMATESPIDVGIVVRATARAFERLDESFFRVRFDRLTPGERSYVIAMAKLGSGPYRSADVAAKLGEELRSLGPRRAGIIRKGMIYSPAHGDVAFTVPMFDDYLRRIHIT
jgi:hypothetical protein